MTLLNSFFYIYRWFIIRQTTISTSNHLGSYLQLTCQEPQNKNRIGWHLFFFDSKGETKQILWICVTTWCPHSNRRVQFHAITVHREQARSLISSKAGWKASNLITNALCHKLLSYTKKGSTTPRPVQLWSSVNLKNSHYTCKSTRNLLHIRRVDQVCNASTDRLK